MIQEGKNIMAFIIENNSLKVMPPPLHSEKYLCKDCNWKFWIVPPLFGFLGTVKCPRCGSNQVARHKSNKWDLLDIILY
jgi:DNA-directed RNA polymerase subunit RPC12/RpoP